MTRSRSITRLLQHRYGRPPRRITPEWRPDQRNAVDVTVESVSGHVLRGWFLPGDVAAPGGPAALVMHGWGGSAQEMAPLAGPLRASGFHVLLLDARCHGRSDDDDATSMPAIADDISIGLQWLRERLDVDRSRIALIGHSVGAGACLLVASRDQEVAAVVSIASMAHPATFMETMLQRRLPRPLAKLALRFVERAVGQPFESFAPVNTIGRVRVPVLLVHGDQDRTVPVEDAHTLSFQTGCRAQLLVIPGADHASIGMLDDVGPKLAEFLRGAVSFS
ncbi:MAG TPA: alpha/beta fold hydrolase [Actinomycetota bacterium]|nr:alpha/beta fold hydrolase [Actinomycetota bacterium]